MRPERNRPELTTGLGFQYSGCPHELKCWHALILKYLDYHSFTNNVRADVS